VETAKSAGRAQFAEMLKFLRSHPDIRAILVEKTDRLYRNFKDYVTMEELDREIHLVKEGEILSKESRSYAKLVHAIKVVLAKNYIDNLSEEVKKGMREKAEGGDYPGPAPFGYRNNTQTKTIEICPQEASIVKAMFEVCLHKNYSLKEIRDFISREYDLKIPKSTIHFILTKPIYCGYFL
jgi:DNA invertase Pin-like site-specific DNA recombinase